MTGELFEKVIDELIALIVVIATVAFLYLRIELPEWWATAFGVVITFYFTRKTAKESR